MLQLLVGEVLLVSGNTAVSQGDLWPQEYNDAVVTGLNLPNY